MRVARRNGATCNAHPTNHAQPDCPILAPKPLHTVETFLESIWIIAKAPASLRHKLHLIANMHQTMPAMMEPVQNRNTKPRPTQPPLPVPRSAHIIFGLQHPWAQLARAMRGTHLVGAGRRHDSLKASIQLVHGLSIVKHGWKPERHYTPKNMLPNPTDCKATAGVFNKPNTIQSDKRAGGGNACRLPRLLHA